MRQLVLRVFLSACCLSAMYCGGDDAKAPSDGGAPDSTLRDSGTVRDAGRVGDAGHRDGAAQDGSVGDAAPPPTDGAFFDGPLEPDVDSGDSVLRHHKNYNRDGLYIEPALTKAAVTGTAGDGGSTDGGSPGLHVDPNFSATLPDPNDHVYAQPLFVDGLGGQDMVIVATEANNIYALDATTGAQLWVHNVGTPVPLADEPCGNIDPFGVTGTPVIDFPSRTVFFDAEVLPSGADAGDAGTLPKHEIFALSIDTGVVKAGWPIDVGVVAKSGANGFNAPFQGQRGALAVLGGMLYVPYGGLFGDCQPTDSGPAALYPDPDFSPYRGWVVGVSISDPSVVHSWATPACGGGAWVPGGVSSDGTSLYISAGNTEPSCTKQGTVWGGGDAVLRFAAGGAIGAPADYFAPTNWPVLDDGDQEFGTAPIVFDLADSTPGQLALVFGKDGNAYLLDRTHLGGVGSALGADAAVAIRPYATLQAAVTPIITAPALYTTAVATYVTFFGNGAFCQGAGGGTIASLTITPGTPPTLAGAWCATGGNGSPMVTTSDGHADAIVWQLGAEGDNHLHAFDGDTGAALAFSGRNVNIPNMRRFNSPIAAKGRIFVAADGAVVAFTP